MSNPLEELKNTAENMSFEDMIDGYNQLYNYANNDDDDNNDDDNNDDDWSQTSWERGDDETNEDYEDRMEDLDNYLDGILDD